MRLLNKDEQELCRRILDGNGYNNYLGNIIDDKLWGVRISITRQPQNVDLLFTIQNPQPTQDEIDMTLQRSQEISVLILNVVNLIKLLEKENYIMLLQRATQISNQSMFGKGISNLPSISSSFSDPTISTLLIDYVDKEIFVTEEFRQFCNNGFIARDEQRFRRQIFITTSALIVAITALVVNTVFNLLPKFTGGTKIKQEQIDSIRTDLQKINSSIDTLNAQTKTTNKFDTLVQPKTTTKVNNDQQKKEEIKTDNKTKNTSR
jgi:hypothetical protein